MISKKHLENLFQSGLQEQTIEKAKLYSTDNQSELKDLMKWSPKDGFGDCLVFPFTRYQTGYRRIRPEKPIDMGDGKTAKYLSPRGSDPEMYCPVWDLDWMKLYCDVSAPMWITEGEKKTLRILQDDRACIGIPGIWMGTDKDHKLQPLIKDWTKKNRKSIVLFDQDFDTNNQLPKAMARLILALSEAGADPHVTFIPVCPAKGIDDYLVYTNGDWSEIDIRIRKATTNPEDFISVFKTCQDKTLVLTEARRSVRLINEMDPDSVGPWVSRVSEELDINILTGEKTEAYKTVFNKDGSITYIDVDGTEFFGGQSRLLGPSDVDIARYVISKLGLAVYSPGNVWVYNQHIGIWEIFPEEKLDALIESVHGEPIYKKNDKKKVTYIKLSHNQIKSVLARVKAILRTHEKWFNDRPAGVTFKNGWMDADLNFHPHCPTQRSIHALPGDWTNEIPELWNKTVSDVLADDEDDETHAKVKLLEEFIGVALLGKACKLSRAMILLGRPGSGKSSLAKTIGSLWSPSVRTALDPQDFTHRFRASVLSRSEINIVGECSTEMIRDASKIKAVITGSDTLTIEKKHQDGYEFVPRGAQLWVSNAMPVILDPGGALLRRFAILRCDQTFSGTDDCDLNRADKLAEERTRIAAKCLRAGVEALRRGDYILPKSSIEEVKDWSDAGSPLNEWIDNCCEKVSHSDGSTAEELFESWNNWSMKLGRDARIGTPKQFSVKLKDAGYMHSRPRVGQSRATRYPLKIKSTEFDMN